MKNNIQLLIRLSMRDVTLCTGSVASAMRIITLSEPLFSFTVPANIKSGADLKLVKPVDFRLLAACVTNLFSRLDS
ncbi:MAG: hypothetical protein WCI01_05520 [Chlorobiaceae bacterium]